MREQKLASNIWDKNYRKIKGSKKQFSTVSCYSLIYNHLEASESALSVDQEERESITKIKTFLTQTLFI